MNAEDRGEEPGRGGAGARGRDRRIGLDLRRRGAAARRPWYARLLTKLSKRGVLVVDGVRYRPRGAARVREAGSGLSERADYDVRFADGGSMRIRATRERCFADLRADPRLALVQQLGPLVEPGARVIEIGSGTGAGTAWLAERAGPSGSAIGVESDRESVRYARRRYPTKQMGVEIRGDDPIAWEDEGSFDVVVCHLAGETRAASLEMENDRIAGLLRVLACPGCLLLTGPSEMAGEMGAEGRLDGLVRSAATRRLEREIAAVRALDEADEESEVEGLAARAAMFRHVDAGVEGWRGLIVLLPRVDEPESPIEGASDDRRPGDGAQR